jgi:hypothetical protein
MIDLISNYLLAQIHSQAVEYFFALPQNKDLAKHKLLSEDWDKLRDIEFVLSVRHSHNLPY